MTCQAQQRLPEATELLRRALTVFERTLEPHHPTLAACRENYATALKQGP
jgi:Tetratricopeptide repeat